MLLVAAACAGGLAACDTRADPAPPKVGLSLTACQAALEPVPPVCPADAAAHGGANVFCYQIDSQPAVTVADLVNVYATRAVAAQQTDLGIQIDAGPAQRDGVALLVDGTGTGAHALARFTAWTHWDSAAPGLTFAAVGIEDGCGLTHLDSYGPAVSGRIQGSFDATLCAYNGNLHLVQCALGQMRLRGAFDIARAADSP